MSKNIEMFDSVNMKIVINNKILRISECAFCITYRYYQNKRRYIIYAYIISSFFKSLIMDEGVKSKIWRKWCNILKTIITKTQFETGWIANAREQIITISSAWQLMFPQSGQLCFIFVKKTKKKFDCFLSIKQGFENIINRNHLIKWKGF